MDLILEEGCAQTPGYEAGDKRSIMVKFQALSQEQDGLGYLNSTVFKEQQEFRIMTIYTKDYSEWSLSIGTSSLYYI